MPAEPADARRCGVSEVTDVALPGSETLSIAVTLPEQAEMNRNRRLRNIERVDQFVCDMVPPAGRDAHWDYPGGSPAVSPPSITSAVSVTQRASSEAR